MLNDIDQSFFQDFFIEIRMSSNHAEESGILSRGNIHVVISGLKKSLPRGPDLMLRIRKIKTNIEHRRRLKKSQLRHFLNKESGSPRMTEKCIY